MGGCEHWVPGLLSDHQIRHLAQDHGMIEPFEPEQVREREMGRDTGGTVYAKRVISYGTSSYGYDMRAGGTFNIFKATTCEPVDPKRMPDEAFDVVYPGPDGFILIPPNSFALSVSVECFNLPRGVLGVVVGKSTYARCGISVPLTPIEPEWRGHLTIEISNTTPLPAKVYAGEGIAQILFFKASASCSTSYDDRGGKYQDQQERIYLPEA